MTPTSDTLAAIPPDTVSIYILDIIPVECESQGVRGVDIAVED